MYQPTATQSGGGTHGRHDRSGKPETATVAYAGDVTDFLTEPDEVQTLQEIFHIYEEATGPEINMDKSKALAIGGWDVTKKIMNISYHEEIRILGFKRTNRSNISNKEYCAESYHRYAQQPKMHIIGN